MDTLVITKRSQLTDIADAIRTKTGNINGISIEDMPKEISKIKSGNTPPVQIQVDANLKNMSYGTLFENLVDAKVDVIVDANLKNMSYGTLFENLVDTTIDTVVIEEEIGANPIVDISMSDGSNLGVGGEKYAAVISEGAFSDGKFVLNGAGYLSIEVDFMNTTNPWTIAFTIDKYTTNSSASYSRIARGNNDVPSIFYTKSVSKFQAKLANASANTKHVTVVNSSEVTTDSSTGACMFTFTSGTPTTFVFRNNGQDISLWKEGKEIMREPIANYTTDKHALNFSIGDNAGVGCDMNYLECSMLKAWDRALTSVELAIL